MYTTSVRPWPSIKTKSFVGFSWNAVSKFSTQSCQATLSIQSPDRPARSESLCRVSYICHILVSFCLITDVLSYFTNLLTYLETSRFVLEHIGCGRKSSHNLYSNHRYPHAAATTNQNTKPCQRRTDTQRPVLVTQCLTATSTSSSKCDQLGNTGIAFCSCEAVCGDASLPLGNTSRSGDRTGRIEKCVVLAERSAAHPWRMQHAQTVLCWSQKVLHQVPVTSGSGCDCSWCWLSQLWGQMTVTTPHTAHRGGRKTRLRHIARVSWQQWRKFCPITHPENWKWVSTDIIHSFYACNWLCNSDNSTQRARTCTGHCSIFTRCANHE